VALRLASLAAAFLVAIVLWKRLAPPSIPCKPALALWALVALASLVGAVDPSYSLGEIKNEILYTVIAFLAFFTVTRQEGDLERLLLVLFGGALVLCALALDAHLRLGMWNDESLHGGIAAFAGYAVALAPMLFLYGAYASGRWRRAAVILAFAVLAFVSFLSLQRIVWWVFAAEAAIALVLLRHFGLTRLSRTGLAACLVGTAALSGGIFVAAQTERFGGQGAIVEDIRLGQWPLVVERIAQHPIVGGGFGRGAMSKAYPDLVPERKPWVWHAHNVFLNYGLEMGLPGMLVLAWVFFSLLREYWRLCNAPDEKLRFLGIAGLMLIAGVVLRNQVNDMFLREQSLMFWALNGALLGSGLRGLSRPGEPAARST